MHNKRQRIAHSPSFTAVTVSLSSAIYSASEGNEFCNVSLELTEAAEREVTVLIHTEDGAATGNEESGWKWKWQWVSCALPPFSSQ